MEKIKIEDKIFSRESLKSQCIKWRQAREKMVFTNGCFDLLHKGHVSYLQDAARRGTKLIVGLNSDHSVRLLKGASRPIQNEEGRAWVLAALGMVDAVVLFEEETPESLIGELLPDVLVKGGDWKVDQIVGAQTVINHGGEVISLPFIKGYSTTDIEQKILNKCGYRT